MSLTFRRRSFRPEAWGAALTIAAFSVILAASISLAESKNGPKRFQGVVMGWEGGTLIINEKSVLTTPRTSVRTSDNAPASLSQLIPGQRVFVVAEKTPRGVIASEIYLLPKRVEGKDKSKYPFMQKPKPN